ncbi:MAG TPA: tail fiber protein [Polyangiaceae bacterium]|nr:tail fiber protein [Polyangiaceae bacterium]
MLEPFIGSIILFCGNFAPKGWALCDGQLLSIAQNTALFSILGTTFGGNGQTTFALPDLRGRVPLHPGSGPGLSPYNLGQAMGVESVTLITTQMPAHNHGFATPCSDGAPTTPSPLGAVLANQDQTPFYASSGTSAMAAATSTIAGGGQAHENRQPLLAINFIIALEGIFPSRN